MQFVANNLLLNHWYGKYVTNFFDTRGRDTSMVRSLLHVAVLAAATACVLAEKGDLYGKDGKEKNSLVEQVPSAALPPLRTSPAAIRGVRGFRRRAREHAGAASLSEARAILGLHRTSVYAGSLLARIPLARPYRCVARDASLQASRSTFHCVHVL